MGALMRLYDWHKRLHDLFGEVAKMELEPLKVMAGVAFALTGKNPLDYPLTLAADAGGPDLARAVAHLAAHAGYAEQPYPLLAQRGDWVVLAGEAVGFVALDGRRVWIPTGYGLASGLTDSVIKAWRVE
jgi:hypothetical protein